MRVTSSGEGNTHSLNKHTCGERGIHHQEGGGFRAEQKRRGNGKNPLRSRFKTEMTFLRGEARDGLLPRFKVSLRGLPGRGNKKNIA